MKFLSNVLAVIVGLLVFWVMAFFIIAGIVAISAADEKVSIDKNTVLILNLDGKSIVERTSDDEFDFSMLGGFGGTSTVGLIQLKRAIATAKENDNISGIYLKAGLVNGGQAMLKELREALAEFKESDKFVVSYGEIYTEPGYYLSSVADEIYLNPQGMLELNGLGAEMVFLKGFFEKIEVEPVVFRVGDFKSAVEPFIMEKMSEESRLQTTAYLNDLNEVMLAAISESRSIPIAELRNISQHMLGQSTKDVLNLKLVDGLSYDDEIMALLREKLELSEDDKIETINVTQINKTGGSTNRLSKNRIAVVLADGDIVSGTGEESIASETFLQEIRKLKKNKDIKAVVLRINSPGGSAMASEVIWRELSELKKEKPLIASMSNVAASGGYYIAAPADTILAQPNTITGSIGIFGMWFNAKGLLNNKLGITTDVVKTGEFSDFPSATRDMRPEEEAIFQRMVEEGYETFLSRVTEGRQMSKEELLPLASGRVWSGVQAQQNGLVDLLGGLEEAIEIAAAKAEVADDYRVVYYPEQKSFFEKLLSEFSRDVQLAYSRLKWGMTYEIYQQVEKIKRMEGVMARMPFDAEIR
ncbi:signal peptide peptidase SppA [Lunatibacter salilacus]|uniref:signal peptide peptidase SppA n=1 Tax=Lunatibacter salilacus TaxID=2483804 RepID=UPI00131EC475|nr:signal peptide peptidase SppA [Lunatibacter salilacus]